MDIKGKNLQNTLKTIFILSIVFFSFLLNNSVDQKREMPWEPDDVSHYILKKTQINECFFQKCQFNESFQKYLEDEVINDQRIIKRTVLEYHPLYSIIFLSIDKFVKNSYITFNIISIIASTFLLIYLFKIFHLFLRPNSTLYNIIFSILILIFIFDLTFMWRTSAKLNFVIFTYLLTPIINAKKIKTKNYFLNILQVFIHPIGIISSLIIVFFYYLKSHNYKFKNIINLRKKFYYKLFTFLLVLFNYYYYNFEINYVDAKLSIHSALVQNNIFETLQHNASSIVAYYKNSANIVFFIPLIILIKLKKINKYKILLYIFLIINFIHLINPSPEKSIINFFDFFIKFCTILFLFEIIILKDQKFLKVSIILLTLIPQAYFQAKNVNSFYKVRHVIDSLDYSEIPKKVREYLNKDKKIFLVSASDLLLYHQLNNGLIDYNLYFNGLDNKKFSKYFSNDLEILLIFDFLNNPYNKNFVKKDIYNDNIRLFSNMLYSNDSLSLNNNSNKTLFLKLYSKKLSKISINNKDFQIKDNSFKEIEILPKNEIRIKNNKINGYLKLVSIKNNSSKYNFPWGKKVSISIFNNLLHDKITIDFNENYSFETCKIKDILDDSSQNIYAIAKCRN